jgi:hypothetical protein
MAACATCGTTILFGGQREGDLQFCNAKCHQQGHLVRIARSINPDAIAQQSAAIYHGRCPKCEGPGPVDVRTSYRMWSALLLTSYNSNVIIACVGCGRKQQAADALFSLILGWWGFPWGLLMTPVQIYRNLAGMFGKSDEHRPSPELDRAVGLMMASRQGASR